MEPWMVSTLIGGGLIVLLMSGMPLAFALIGLSSIGLWALIGSSSLLMIVSAAFGQVESEVFIAIPLFVLMAAVLASSGVAEALYKSMHMWMGGLRGGLVMGTLVICAIVAALSGIGATATTAMGVIALPEMMRRGYHKDMAVGSITVGGALGPLIPPSVLMIIVGGYSQLSVGRLFLSGVFPGLLVVVAWSVYVFIRCTVRPDFGPPLPKEERGTLAERVASLRYVFLPIGLASFIMGGIYSGIFTPTEAAGFGAFGAVLISIIHRQFTFGKLFDSLQMSMRVSCMILWLIIGGACYSTLVTLSGTSSLVSGALASLPFGSVGVIIVMLSIGMILGMFIDPIAISMICIPVFLPIVNGLGIDLLWFMVLFVMVMVIGYITPPFGLNLFYMKGVAPEGVSMMDIYRSVIPFVVIMTACLILCAFFPGIVTWLPSLMK